MRGSGIGRKRGRPGVRAGQARVGSGVVRGGMHELADTGRAWGEILLMGAGPIRAWSQTGCRQSTRECFYSFPGPGRTGTRTILPLVLSQHSVAKRKGKERKE